MCRWEKQWSRSLYGCLRSDELVSWGREVVSAVKVVECVCCYSCCLFLPVEDVLVERREGARCPSVLYLSVTQTQGCGYWLGKDGREGWADLFAIVNSATQAK